MEVDVMADSKANLDFLSPEKREFLRRRAERRGSTVEEELERAIGEVMEAAEAEGPEGDADEEGERPRRPIDELESVHTPATLARAREADRRLNAILKRRSDHKQRSKDLSGIIGIVHGDGSVTGRNFHDYLYGREDENG